MRLCILPCHCSVTLTATLEGQRAQDPVNSAASPPTKKRGASGYFVSRCHSTARSKTENLVWFWPIVSFIWGCPVFPNSGEVLNVLDEEGSEGNAFRISAWDAQSVFPSVASADTDCNWVHTHTDKSVTLWTDSWNGLLWLCLSWHEPEHAAAIPD